MKTLIRCVIVENLVIDISFIIVTLVSFGMVRANWVGFVVVASWVLMLALSVAALFVDRRLAGHGFLVVALGVLIGLLFPAL